MVPNIPQYQIYGMYNGVTFFQFTFAFTTFRAIWHLLREFLHLNSYQNSLTLETRWLLNYFKILQEFLWLMFLKQSSSQGGRQIQKKMLSAPFFVAVFQFLRSYFSVEQTAILQEFQSVFRPKFHSRKQPALPNVSKMSLKVYNL